MELFKIAGTIAINSQEAEEGMDKAKNKAKDTASSMEGSFGKIGSAALKVGKVIATGLAAGAAAVGALAKSSIDSFAEFEQLEGGAKLMFGEAYDFIADKAKNAYATVQMSQNDYMKQVNGFAVGLKTALGGDAQAAAELADKIITAEADIVAATGNSQEAVQNAFNGIMKGNFTMLDNLQLGITPTKEGFQEVIDKVNEWNKANGEATKYQIDNLADCQAALVKYVEMQGLAGYAANEASETIQGSLAAAKAAWQNLLTGVATDGSDMDSLIEGLVTSVTTAANRIVPRLAQILGGLSTALVQLVPIISAELPGLLGQLLPSLTEGAVSLIGGLVAALPGLVTMLTTSVIPQLLGGVIEITNALISALPGVIGAIASALPILLPQLIKGIISVITTLFSNFSEIIQPIIDALPDIIMSVIEALLENLPALIDGVIALVMGIVDATPEIIQSLVDMLPKIIEMYVTAMIACTPQLLMGAFQLVGGVIKALPSLLASLITGAVNSIVAYFSALWDGLSEIFGQLAGWFDENVVQPVSEKVEAIKSAVSEKWEQIKSAIITPIEEARDKVKAVIDKIKGFFNFQISWPHIPMPHFSISPAGWKIGDLLKGIKPELSIEWYAKAMDNPMLMTDPTIFGYNPKTGSLMGGGEKGDEVVSGADTLMNMIGAAVEAKTSEQTERLVSVMTAVLEAIMTGNQDLLQALLAGHVIKLNGREVGRTVRTYA